MELAQLTAKQIFESHSVVGRFEKILGQKAQGFVSSVLQIINTSTLIAKAEPTTVLNAAATAASLDLPINPSLGYSYIVPYKGRAQFQIGWKGLVQLAQRSGQYKRINVIEVYENQFKSFNRLSEKLDADFDIEGEGEIIGYVAYFCLINGMEKLSYWSKDEVLKHAQKYSQSFKHKSSPWQTEFDAMAKKTVLKNTLAKWGIMTIDMQTAQLADQSVQLNEGEYEYPDNSIDLDELNKQEEKKRILSFIEKANSIESLEEYLEYCTEDQELEKAFTKKQKELAA